MKKLPLLILSLLIIVTLASCEFDVATETTVYPDGSLDKTIAVEKTDSAKFLFNVSTWEKSVVEKPDSAKFLFNVSTWGESIEDKRPAAIDSVRSTTKIDSAKSIGPKIKVFNKFHKKFNSTEEVNAELSQPSDTLIRVTTLFEKKFRWFYTYITYSETYHKLNTLKLNPGDYFTQEDYAFIDRLPAEGQKISKADELYLRLLNNKIFDEYGEKALYDELFDLALLVVTTQPGIDSLKKHKRDFREAFEKMDEKKIDEDKLLLATIDSFKIPIDQAKIAEFESSQQKFWKKMGFISSASDGKFANRLNLPWTIVNTNADSVSGNSLFWAPPTIKFLLKDYTMYGECRKLNWWAVIVSVLFIGFTGYLFIRKSEIMIRFNNRIISIPRKDA